MLAADSAGEAALRGNRGRSWGGATPATGPPADPVPAVAGRQRVDEPRDQRGIRLGDQRPQAVGPATELGLNGGPGRGVVAEIDAADPLLRRLQGRVHVQAAV